MKHWPTKPLGNLVAIEKGKKAPGLLAVSTQSRARYLQIEDLRPAANIKYCQPFACPNPGPRQELYRNCKIASRNKRRAETICCMR
jgi:hypothetical protein